MCLSLEHQNPSKTSEIMGYFDRVEDRVTVSLHILYTANQETWLIIVVQQCQLMACEAVSDGYSADPGDVDKR